VSRSHLSPPSWNGQEEFWQFQNKFRLLVWREHQVPVPLILRCEGGKDPASYPEIGRPHVGAFLRPFEAQGNPTEIRCIHLESLPLVIDHATAHQFEIAVDYRPTEAHSAISFQDSAVTGDWVSFGVVRREAERIDTAIDVRGMGRCNQ
jgi:hypothetical protein